MIPYRKLSIELTDLLAEAQALVDLKAEFGRLPNSPMKMAALKAIEEWFNAAGEDTPDTDKPKQYPTEVPTDAIISQGAGFLSASPADRTFMADKVPDDDDIPF